MKITWLGHSAFRIETADAKILIDPFLTGNPSFAGHDRQMAADGITIFSSPTAMATMSAIRLRLPRTPVPWFSPMPISPPGWARRV